MDWWDIDCLCWTVAETIALVVCLVVVSFADEIDKANEKRQAKTPNKLSVTDEQVLHWIKRWEKDNDVDI